MTSHLLARFRVSPAGFPEPTLYVRHRDGMIDDEGLHLMKGGRATFDTTFGVFSAGRWARLTDIADVIVRINATGRVRVELVSYADGVDTVVLSCGGEPRGELGVHLREQGLDVHVIGDAYVPRRQLHAVRQAYAVVAQLD